MKGEEKGVKGKGEKGRLLRVLAGGERVEEKNCEGGGEGG